MVNKFNKITIDLDLNDKEALAKVNNFVKKLESAGIQSRVVPVGEGKAAVVYPRQALPQSAWKAREELGGKKSVVTAENLNEAATLIDSDYNQLHKALQSYIKALNRSTMSLVKLTPEFKQLQQDRAKARVVEDTARGKVTPPGTLITATGGKVAEMGDIDKQQRAQKEAIDKKKLENKLTEERNNKYKKYGNHLDTISRSTLMLNMGFLGMWFSFYGLFNMFRGGLMSLVTPLQDLGGTLAGGALAGAFLPGYTGLAGADIGEMIKGWKTVQGAMGAIQLEMAKAGARIFGDEEFRNLLIMLIQELSGFLTSDQFKNNVQELIKLLKNSLPDIMESVYMISGMLKWLLEQFIKYPLFLKLVMSSIVAMPILSVLNFIAAFFVVIKNIALWILTAIRVRSAETAAVGLIGTTAPAAAGGLSGLLANLGLGGLGGGLGGLGLGLGAVWAMFDFEIFGTTIMKEIEKVGNRLSSVILPQWATDFLTVILSPFALLGSFITGIFRDEMKPQKMLEIIQNAFENTLFWITDSFYNVFASIFGENSEIRSMISGFCDAMMALIQPILDNIRSTADFFYGDNRVTHTGQAEIGLNAKEYLQQSSGTTGSTSQKSTTVNVTNEINIDGAGLAKYQNIVNTVQSRYSTLLG